MSSLAQQPRSNQVAYMFQGELVRARVRKPALTATPVRPGGDRQAITHFSRRSRKHLLDTFAIMQWYGHTATFITLTYHDDLPTAEQAKTHLRAFLKRVFRRFGEVPVVWRLEPQARGAWHFHLIAVDLPYYHWKECLKDWREVTGDPTITNIKLEFCYTSKQVRCYVAKYVAKVAPQSNLDTAANLAADHFPGRFWGIENRKNITWAQIIEVISSTMDGLHDFKRAARRYWRGINRKGDAGFSLYVQNAERWFEYLLFCLG
jgi:hypothetical protein